MKTEWEWERRLGLLLVCAAAQVGCGGSEFDETSSDMRIDPIEVGHAWTYDVQVFGTYPLCEVGSFTGTAVGEKELDGKQSIQVQSLCPHAGVISYAVDGDRVEVYYAGEWVLALDAPVEDGHTWSNGTEQFMWERVGRMETKAGTFDHCFRARELNTPDSYTTFCRGVGPVVWHTVKSGNGYDAELTSVNF